MQPLTVDRYQLTAEPREGLLASQPATMVLVVLHIRDRAKILKPWYAFGVPETATLTDGYVEFSSGLLDSSSPLPEEYRTTSVKATIGRSSSNLDTNISCSVKVGDAVSCLGNCRICCVQKAVRGRGEFISVWN